MPAYSYPTTILADSPAAYWRLGDPVGTTFADSKASNTATGNGTYSRSQPAFGDIGASVFLDGASGYLSVAGDASLPAGDTFTVEAWVKVTAGVDAVMQIVSQGANGFSLRRDANGFLALVKEGGSTIVTAKIPLPKDGFWHHVAATKATTASKLYQDGVDVTGAVSNQTISAPGTGALAIGRSQESANSYFRGFIDDVAVYKTALVADRFPERYAYLAPVPAAPVETTTLAYLQSEAARLQPRYDMSSDAQSGKFRSY